MTMYKRDARSVQTEKKFKQNLIRLSEAKPLSKITVAELCKVSGVNRGTFYNHFNNIDDVMERIENDVFDEVKSNLDDIKLFSFDESFFRKITDIIKNNLQILRLIVKNNFIRNNLLHKVYYYSRGKYIKDLTEYNSNIKEKEAEDLFTYTFGGSIGLFLDCLRDPSTLDDAAKKADYHNDIIVKKFLKDKKL